MNERPLSKEHEVGIAVGIILSVATCGLYNIWWNYKEMQALNALLGRQEYVFINWLLLSIITCGIYHVYYEYKMGQDLYAELKRRGVDVNPNLPILGLVLSIFALSVVADAVYQHEINKLVA